MKGGNGLPISNAFVKYLPNDREYSELEAAYSLQLKYDIGDTVTTAGLAKLWGWSRKRVVNFIRILGVKIEYPLGTNEIQNQRGQIAIQIGDRSGADRGQIKFIDSKQIISVKDRPGTDREQIGGRPGSTSINPIDPNPEKEKKEKPIVDFPDWLPIEEWEAYKNMRRQIKKPMSDYAEKLAVKQLGSLRNTGNNPKAVLEQSILNSWQGLFELKNKPAPPMERKFAY